MVGNLSLGAIALVAFAEAGDTKQLFAEKKFIKKGAKIQHWGDGVTLEARSLDGKVGEVVYDDEFKDKGFGVAGGRWKQIDFYAEGGNRSEQLIVNFNGTVKGVVFVVGMLGFGEGRNGFHETGKWTVFDAENKKLGEGLIGPELSRLGKDKKAEGSYGKYPIEVKTTKPIAKLTIAATGFGHGEGKPHNRNYGENNSDLNLVEVRYIRLSGGGNNSVNLRRRGPVQVGKNEPNPGVIQNLINGKRVYRFTRALPDQILQTCSSSAGCP